MTEHDLTMRHKCPLPESRIRQRSQSALYSWISSLADTGPLTKHELRAKVAMQDRHRLRFF